MQKSNFYHIYPELALLGYTAGVTLKGPWTTFDDVYSFIRQDLLPPGMKMIAPIQAHGIDIAIIDSDDGTLKSEIDGVITRLNNICLTVTTADCLPVLFVDPITGIRAVVHIGWRSFVGGIIENYFDIAEKLGANRHDTRAVIGPGIGNCCFEVGSDVAMLFDDKYIRRASGSCYVDLRQAVWNKIESLGVVKATGISECTSCMSDKYYSYRRDKDSPIQMVTFIFKSER